MHRRLVCLSVLIAAVAAIEAWEPIDPQSVGRIGTGVPKGGGGGGGGGSDTPTAANFVHKGIFKIRTNIGLDNRAPATVRYQGTCPGVSCKAQLLYLGQINAANAPFVSTIASGASTTGARVFVTTGTPPAVGQYLAMDATAPGQRYIVQIATRAFVSGSNWDLTWTPALPNTPGIGYTVASEYQQLYRCDIPTVASLTDDVSTTSSCTNEQLIGDIYLGHRLVMTHATGDPPSAGAVQTYGLSCSNDNCDDLWWTYNVNYAAQNWIPSLGLTHIDWTQNPPTVTAAAGPWRVQNNACCPVGSSTNWVFADMIKVPTAWALTNLGNASAYAVLGGPTSGTPLPLGSTAHAIVGSNIPTISTPDWYHGGSDIPTTPLLSFDSDHRQARDTNYVAHYGSAPWGPIATGTPTTTQATLTTAPIQEANACTTEGNPPSGTVYWCTGTDCGVVHGQGTITGCTGNTLSYTITSGATPVAGDVFIDSRTFSAYAASFPPIQYTTSAANNWIDAGTTGVGVPTHGYFLIDSDNCATAAWLKNATFDALLSGCQIGSGHAWYGQVNQCGHNHESKWGTASQGPVSETSTPTVFVWSPTDIAAIVAGGSSMANTSSKAPVRQIDMVPNTGFHCASGVEAYPGGQSSQPVLGKIFIGYDPQDGTKTMMLIMAPNSDLPSHSPFGNIYYIQ